MVQADGGHAGKALPGQRGQTALEDPEEVIGLQPHMGDPQPEIAAPAAAQQQQAEADKLADDRRPCRAGNPQLEREDQQRIQPDVQHCAAGDAHHGIGGAALKAQLVVQHQRSRHPRRSQQDHAEVCLGIGQDGIRGTQQIGQRLQKQQPQHTDQHAGGQRTEKSRGGHFRGFLIVLMADGAGDEVAAALAEEEPDGLDNGHQGKHHAHGAGGRVAFQHPHQEGVRHVVKGGHQHADDAGHSQPQDQGPHRCLRHLFVFFGLLVVQCYPSRKNKNAIFVYYSTILTPRKPLRKIYLPFPRIFVIPIRKKA